MLKAKSYWKIETGNEKLGKSSHQRFSARAGSQEQGSARLSAEHRRHRKEEPLQFAGTRRSRQSTQALCQSRRGGRREAQSAGGSRGDKAEDRSLEDFQARRRAKGHQQADHARSAGSADQQASGSADQQACRAARDGEAP